MRILVINGPNLNMLGVREPAIYGSGTFRDLEESVRAAARDLGIDAELYQSNHEGDIVDRIQQALGRFDGILINPGAYTHTSVAILDALKAVRLPVCEVHISDISAREDFRKFSYVSLYAGKTIAGQGFAGYRQGLEWLKNGQTDQQNKEERSMYAPATDRYEHFGYNRCGLSGLKLSPVSLGLWHNFGSSGDYGNMRAMCETAFDLGITHFDLANNYGPPEGSAEENFGRILRDSLKPWRDEIVVSTKAGYYMWPGPYGEWGSRKYLIASLDQSLKRMGLDYVDIYYHHRPDPDTPLEETADALGDIVRQGKALYAGISNYDGERMAAMAKLCADRHIPFVINQNRYSIFDRTIENNGLKAEAERLGKGVICFSPLAQGLLTGRYLHGIPEDSRMRTDGRFLKDSALTEERLAKIRALNGLAEKRGQTLAQMALQWVLKDSVITSVIIGASRPEQIAENTRCVSGAPFTREELDLIDRNS